jgi:DNA-binding NarL/FixJ family response regulator
MARGLANPQIAERLTVSEATVKSHVAHILEKLQVQNRVQAVVIAYESRLVSPGDSATEA